jgi:hypothetical protein
VLTVSLVALLGAGTPASEWVPLGAGVEYRTFQLGEPSDERDALLHVVRVEPSRADLAFGLVSEVGGPMRTAREWCEKGGFIAVINAGMYAQDFSTNVGFLKHKKHANNRSWNKQYQSVLVFDPLAEGTPKAQLIDRDETGAQARIAAYGSAVQNLRLMKGNGTSVWRPNGKRWSEALVAQDREGRVLFVFSTMPHEMADLNARLLLLPLGVTRAMHMDGGPPASLSLCVEGRRIDLAGAYETDFFWRPSPRQMRIPNVLGVRARKTQAQPR